MSSLIFIGGGGHFRVAYNIAILSQKYRVLGVYDDKDLTGLLPLDVKYMGNIEQIMKDRIDALYFISIGNNSVRSEIFGKLCHHDFFNINLNLIHPTAVLPSMKLFEMDFNNLICAGVVIEPGVKLGSFNIINTHSSINHDCIIGDYIHLAPNTTLCGNVKIDNGTFIGAGTIIIPKISIGSQATIGSNSNVIRDIPDYSLAYGNPCKIIKSV